MEILITIMLAAALIVATITDLRSQRIYNWLTFPLIISGLLAHTVFSGVDGLLLSLGGFGLGLGLMVVPFFMGMMGAGDVKLMAGIGAWLGANTTFTAFLFTCMVGGLYAIIVLLRHSGAMRIVFSNLWGTIVHFFATHRFDYTPVTTVTLPRLCYGVAIAVGTVCALLINMAQTGSVLVR